ncbi:MAG: RecB family exonuclease, partial [Spirochaetota bacterium]
AGPAAVRKGGVDQPVLAVPPSSFSRLDIDRIKRCPVQYYIARVLGIPEPLEPAEEIEPRDVGGLAHELLHRLYREVDFRRNPPTYRELQERMDDLFGSVFPEGLFPSREEALARAILKKNLLACLRYDARRFARGYRPLAELMERELEFRLDDGPVLKGRIDRVDRTPDGEYVVLDYKTGAVPDARDHLEERDFRQVQLAFYGLLFTRTHPGAVVRALSYFDLTRFSAEIPVVEGEEVPGYLERFERHLVHVIDGLHRGELGLATDPQACAFCPYPLVCRRGEP